MKQVPVSIMIFIDQVDESGFKLWMQTRYEDGPLDGLLEFPGGKIEANESPLEAALREVHEEVGIELPKGTPVSHFQIIPHKFKDRAVTLFVHISLYNALPKEKGKWYFVEYSDKSKPFKDRIPEVNHGIIDELAKFLEKEHKARTLEVLWNRSGI